MSSWLRPPKRSESVSVPSGPSNLYSLSTSTHGSVPRPPLKRSRPPVSSPPCASSALPAKSHASGDTAFGWCMIGAPLFGFAASLLSASGRRRHPADAGTARLLQHGDAADARHLEDRLP